MADFNITYGRVCYNKKSAMHDRKTQKYFFISKVIFYASSSGKTNSVSTALKLCLGLHKSPDNNVRNFGVGELRLQTQASVIIEI